MFQSSPPLKGRRIYQGKAPHAIFFIVSILATPEGAAHRYCKCFPTNMMMFQSSPPLKGRRIVILRAGQADHVVSILATPEGAAHRVDASGCGSPTGFNPRHP